jgi:hypothetical protein
MTTPDEYRERMRRGLAPSGSEPKQHRTIGSVGQWEAAAAQEAPRLPWDVFMERWEWPQGQHVGLIGPTGQGKTTLLTAILPRRSFTAVMATKPEDDSMDALIASGYDRFEEWPNLAVSKSPRRVIWPDATDIDAEFNQRKVFEHMFARIYKERRWCLVNDEGWYIADQLKLARQQRVIWTQGRSLGISFVVATQRPAWVPVEMYNMSTHLFFWRTTEKSAIMRIGSLGSANEPLVKYLVPRLEPHQALYINTWNGKMCRTRTPAPSSSRQ